MCRYIQNVHGFEEENIVILMDDGNHTEPTKANIIDAYKTIIGHAEENDAIFLHYSGMLTVVYLVVLYRLKSKSLPNFFDLRSQYRSRNQTS